MNQFNQTRIQSTSHRSPIASAAILAAIGLSAFLVACSPQDDQAGAGGSAVASDSADRKIRSTAGEAVERARQTNAANGGATKAGATTNTDAAAGAAASGSTAAAQSAEETLRKTEAEVKSADAKLDKARDAAKQKITGKPAQ